MFDLDSRLFQLSSEERNVADGSVVPFLCEAIFVFTEERVTNPVMSSDMSIKTFQTSR